MDVARRNKRVIMTKKICLALARKWDSAPDTEILRLCRQRVCMLYGDWQITSKRGC